MKRRSYEDESDDRNAIPIKFDNVIFAMTAKKCAKKCAQGLFCLLTLFKALRVIRMKFLPIISMLRKQSGHEN